MDVDNTPVKEKERLYTAVVYYNPELKALTKRDLEQLKNDPPMQFTTQEHEQGLAYLTGSLNADEIKNNDLLRVLKNTGTQGHRDTAIIYWRSRTRYQYINEEA